jgi:uncharacterized protein (TIGR02246 family)
MSNRKKPLTLVCVLFGGLLGLLVATAFAVRLHANPEGRTATEQQKAEAPPAEGDAREADRAAIRQQTERFLRAFEGGDAEQVASCWTADGELIGDDGVVYRGRAAIAKAYRELFGTKEKRRPGVQRESLRFPSRDTAIEEGQFRVRVDNEEATSSRYSILYAREDGKWLMAVVREWPSEAASLRDLDWLIGTWVAKHGDTEVQTTYEWMWDKSFIRVQFTIRQKDRTLGGFQMIGKDPASGELRTWTFETDGGFGEATWSRDGKKWFLDSAGRLADGTTMAATNILTPLDRDSFTWQSVKRSIDGEEVDDLAPVKVTRVKQKK